MAARSRKRFKRELASADYDKDAVAIFKPGGGLSFHIPDSIRDLVKADQPMPTYVWAILILTHLIKYADSDPTIKAFIETIKDQILLDIETGTDYDIQ